MNIGRGRRESVTANLTCLLAPHESPNSSVVRATEQFKVGPGFEFRRGLRVFLCSALVA